MDIKKVLVVVVLVAAVGAIAYFLPLNKPQLKHSLIVRTWTDRPEYFTEIRTNQYCNNAGYALLKVYSDVRSTDGSIATNALVIGQLQLANSSKLGGEIRLIYNVTSQLWESDWSYFGCVKPGTIDVNITAIDGNNTTDGIYQFSVRENK